MINYLTFVLFKKFMKNSYRRVLSFFYYIKFKLVKANSHNYHMSKALNIYIPVNEYFVRNILEVKS